MHVFSIHSEYMVQKYMFSLSVCFYVLFFSTPCFSDCLPFSFVTVFSVTFPGFTSCSSITLFSLSVCFCLLFSPLLVFWLFTLFLCYLFLVTLPCFISSLSITFFSFSVCFCLLFFSSPCFSDCSFFSFVTFFSVTLPCFTSSLSTTLFSASSTVTLKAILGSSPGSLIVGHCLHRRLWGVQLIHITHNSFQDLHRQCFQK